LGKGSRAFQADLIQTGGLRALGFAKREHLKGFKDVYLKAKAKIWP